MTPASGEQGQRHPPTYCQGSGHLSLNYPKQERVVLHEVRCHYTGGGRGAPQNAATIIVSESPVTPVPRKRLKGESVAAETAVAGGRSGGVFS